MSVYDFLFSLLFSFHFSLQWHILPRPTRACVSTPTKISTPTIAMALHPTGPLSTLQRRGQRHSSCSTDDLGPVPARPYRIEAEFRSWVCMLQRWSEWMDKLCRCHEPLWREVEIPLFLSNPSMAATRTRSIRSYVCSPATGEGCSLQALGSHAASAVHRRELEQMRLAYSQVFVHVGRKPDGWDTGEFLVVASSSLFRESHDDFGDHLLMRMEMRSWWSKVFKPNPYNWTGIGEPKMEVGVGLLHGGSIVKGSKQPERQKPDATGAVGSSHFV